MKINRALVEDCCGWNKKLWADAVTFGLSHLGENLERKQVLEIGAGAYSSLSPIFAQAGASAICSYYGQPRAVIENGQLAFVLSKYNLDTIVLSEMNIFDIRGVYDVIILKSVLGGIVRGNEYNILKSVLEAMLVKNLREGGCIISIDNGYVTLFEKLRQWFGAGKNGWAFLHPTTLSSLLPKYKMTIRGFGFLNAGSMRFLLKSDKGEIINDILYVFDLALIKTLCPRERAVLVTIIEK